MEGASESTLNHPEATALCMGCMEPDTGAAFCPRCGWKRAADSISVLHLRPGTLLQGMYLVGRVLGQGGFGITYLGWDTQLRRKVAIKEFFPQVIASRVAGSSTVAPTSSNVESDYAHGLRSFMNEGRILARFSDHPCIVSVLNLFEANHTGYLVMGYLEGVTLSQSLALSGGKFPYETARDIMMRVMDGLREVHAQGLLHRDISPDNIYLTRQGPVKILDFGAARFEAGERSQSLSVILKEGYAPEEQYRRSGNQGPWTDVYACAATLYRSITGVVPPPALDRLHSDTLQRPSRMGVAIPPGAEAALMRGLAVRAGDRFQSVESFQEALPGPIVDKVKPLPRKGMRWETKAILAAFAVLLLIAGILIYNKVQQDRIEEEQRAAEQRQRDADAAAAAERQRQEEAARQQREAAPYNATSEQYDAWLAQRKQDLGTQGYTVTFENNCSAGPLRIAVRFKLPDNSGRWATDGWWEVKPGESLIPRIVTDNGNFYYWAKEPGWTWDGRNELDAVNATIVDNNFVGVDGLFLDGTNRRTVAMTHMTFDSLGNHTIPFTCTGH